MLNKSILYLIGIFLVVVFSGCRPNISIEGNRTAVNMIDTVALIQFIVSPPTSPSLPLLDAAIYNGDVDDIAPDIIKLNFEKANELSNFTGEFFKDSTDKVLLYGEDFYNSSNYKTLKDNVEIFPLELDDEDFPELPIPKSSYNFFDMYDKEHPIFYLEEEDNFISAKENIKKINEHLGVDALLVIVTGNMPLSAGFFSSSWYTTNTVKLFYFDKNGKLILIAKNESEQISAAGDDIKKYEVLLDEYKKSLPLLLNELYKKDKQN